jgi:hypothetical protein
LFFFLLFFVLLLFFLVFFFFVVIVLAVLRSLAGVEVGEPGHDFLHVHFVIVSVILIIVQVPWLLSTQ